MTLLTCARDLEWIGCIDFGTTFSKFAMVVAADREELNRCDVQPLPISVGPDYRDLNEYLLPSVVFVTEDTLLFSKEASDASKRASGSARSAFLSPKQYLSTFDLAQYDAPLPKEIDPAGKFTARNLLRLFMAHLLERAGAHAKAKDLPWPVPLRIARPAWAKERAKAGEKLLQDLVIRGFALVDLLGPALSKGGGLPHAEALAALKAAEKAAKPDGNMFHLARNGSASVLEATAVATNSRRKRGRRLVVVADIGGGTSDFGTFMTPIRGQKTIAEVKDSSQILKEAGDYLDMQLRRELLSRAGYLQDDPAARGVSMRLLSQARLNKETLFNTSSLSLDVGEEFVTITLEEFLNSPHVKAFAERLRQRFHHALLFAHKCAEANKSKDGLIPPIEIMLTGGGHALPMVQDLLKQPGLPGIYAQTSPEFLESEEALEFDASRRQLAVAIGGAMRDLPSVRSIQAERG
jgi:molecular chaperone DnaK (HSP70)